MSNPIEILNSFLELPYNWNDNNAEPFCVELIAKCKEILQTLTSPNSFIFPCANGSVQFEYGNEYKNMSLNIYIDRIEVNYDYYGEVKEFIENDINKLNEIIKLFEV
jgi:hypothetical protein